MSAALHDAHTGARAKVILMSREGGWIRGPEVEDPATGVGYHVLRAGKHRTAFKMSLETTGHPLGVSGRPR